MHLVQSRTPAQEGTSVFLVHLAWDQSKFFNIFLSCSSFIFQIVSLLVKFFSNFNLLVYLFITVIPILNCSCVYMFLYREYSILFVMNYLSYYIHTLIHLFSYLQNQTNVCSEFTNFVQAFPPSTIIWSQTSTIFLFLVSIKFYKVPPNTRGNTRPS